MTLEQRIAVATILAQGMTAENMQRQTLGYSMAYTYDAFYNLLVEYDLLSKEDVT